MKKLFFLYSQNFSYGWLCARNWQLQSSGQIDPWPNFINKALLKNGEAHSCMSCHCVWNFHCARVELSRYNKPKTIYCLELSRKSLPTPNLDNHGICFLKKRKGEKKRKKENRDDWGLSRQRETELKFHALSRQCAGPRGTPSVVVLSWPLLLRTSIWPNCSNATDRICRRKRKVARAR